MMPAHLLTRLFVCVLAIVTAGSAASPHAQATQSREGRPTRIISLVPAVTEMLFAIGAGTRVVAVSSFDRFPPEVEGLPRVGALVDPNVERILSLRPDLVIVYHTQQGLLTQLARASIPAYVYTHSGLADVTTTIRAVGERTGDQSAANALASRITTAADAVRARVQGRRRPRTMIVFGRDPFALRGIYASGGIGFIHDMLTVAGGDNVFADVKREAVQATTELILARKPELIVELRADPLDAATEAREVRTWQPLASVPAVANGRVRIIADVRTVIPGPRVVEGLEAIAAIVEGAR